MGDICKWPGMDEDGSTFDRLHQVGFDGIPHQHGRGTGDPQIFSGDCFARFADANHDLAQTLTHIF